MRHCNICGKDCAARAEHASVHSNVRKFVSDAFAVWRCPHCLSIHAESEVDLEYYYRFYPFHDLKQSKVDWMLRAMYGKLLRRLRKAGLEKQHQILDYGCGSGAFVEYLHDAGYEYATGYDEYSEAYRNKNALERSYDMVFSQDVLEHIPDPWSLLRALHAVARPGAIIAIGTPNAASIDLGAPEKYRHTLHQPYHRHIFSRGALLDAGDKMGWNAIRYYPTMYTNTWVPFVNHKFLIHYFRCFDDTIDLALEPIKTNSWRLWTPVTLYYALFGCLNAPELDGMAVFQRK
jgi:SAM-dependent methyltransferase